MLQYKNTGKEHYDVFIATPGKNMASEYVKSLLSTIDFLQKNNISWVYSNEYSPLVSNAREATICRSVSLDISNTKPARGEFTYKKIFLIDSDIVWTPDQFMRLFESDKEVLSGVYYDHTGKNAMVHRTKEICRAMTREEMNYEREIFSVYGTGLGFMCINSGILEKMKRPWFPLGKLKVNVNGTDFDLPIGEDLYFCERVSDIGYDVWVDPYVSLGHVKSNVVY